MLSMSRNSVATAMKSTDQQSEQDALKRLLGDRNKAEFARTHAIPGGPSMVSQHLSGNRPISVEAGIAYARAFQVPLSELSPRLARLADAVAATLPAQSTPSNGPAPPPKPDARFTDRREVTKSDWALLNDIKTAMESPRLAAQVEELRREAQAMEAFAAKHYGSKP